MAGGVQPILMLPGTLDANNALVIVIQAASAVVGSTASASGPIAMLQGGTDASNRLLVKLV